MALLEGLDAAALDDVYDAIQLAPGARTMVRTLKRLGYRFAVVSGGFSQVTDRIAADLGIDFAAANELEIVDGRLTGRIIGDVVDRAGKATACARITDPAFPPGARLPPVGGGKLSVAPFTVTAWPNRGWRCGGAPGAAAWEAPTREMRSC